MLVFCVPRIISKPHISGTAEKNKLLFNKMNDVVTSLPRGHVGGISTFQTSIVASGRHKASYSHHLLLSLPFTRFGNRFFFVIMFSKCFLERNPTTPHIPAPSGNKYVRLKVNQTLYPKSPLRSDCNRFLLNLVPFQTHPAFKVVVRLLTDALSLAV